MRWLIASLLAGIVLSVTCDSRACEDYTVARGTAISSERPIAWLILEAGMGVLNGNRGRHIDTARLAVISTSLAIDGDPASGPRGMARAGWRLLGFILWDADGRIERTTTATVRGHAVRISDRIENGRVWLRVVVGPPLGDRRVQYAVLTLEAREHGPTLADRNCTNRTRINLSCSAAIDLPGDRCRLVRRIAVRAAEREAGPELSGRCAAIRNAGQRAVLRGRAAMIEAFLERTCR